MMLSPDGATGFSRTAIFWHLVCRRRVAIVILPFSQLDDDVVRAKVDGPSLCH